MSANTITATHDMYCIEVAETLVREECADQLTAAAWDREACEVEAAWVRDWALTWLSDGTTTCRCSA